MQIHVTCIKHFRRLKSKFIQLHVHYRDTISSSFENTDRGSILTTHYMEEADALCSRIAIMVNGRLE